MKNIIYLIPLFALISCGGSGEAEEETTVQDTIYQDTDPRIVVATELREKFASLQESFTAIGNKEVEESICGATSQVPYRGNSEEMNVWLMSTYMLDNFSNEDFGKHDFKMPEALIRDETPLSELDWLNVSSLSEDVFKIYQLYPELTAVPNTTVDEDGNSVSNDDMVEKPGMLLRAIEDGILGVIAITDYLPPTFVSESEYETGYVMGYIMFADWTKGELSCISPLLAQNTEDVAYLSVNELMADLQKQTFDAIAGIAVKRTGFNGDVLVNDADKLNAY